MWPIRLSRLVGHLNSSLGEDPASDTNSQVHIPVSAEWRQKLLHLLAHICRVMQNDSTSSSPSSLRILPAYTGLNTVETILQVPRARRLLWLEILFNDEPDLQPCQNHSEVQEAYQKACQWFTTYRSLIQCVLPRVSLPLDNGKIDQRDYRRFAEALQF